MKRQLIKNELETEKFGIALASQLKPGDVVCLVGNLGTGKTTLTKAIAKGLGITEMITSPTFTLVQEYLDGRIPLYHFDAYRISDPSEMFEIGFEEYINGSGVCVIEWADQIWEILPKEKLVINLFYGKTEGSRVYEYTGN